MLVALCIMGTLLGFLASTNIVFIVAYAGEARKNSALDFQLKKNTKDNRSRTSL